MGSPHRSVLVLDLDDTLYLERDYALSGFRAVGEYLAQDGLASGFAEFAGRLLLGGRRGDIFDAALAELGVEPAPALIARLVGVYRNHRPSIALEPDAADFLDRVSGNYGLALITDGFFVAQRRKIDALRLDRWPFGPVLCTDLWGREYWKPHRRAFDTVAAAFELPPEAFVYIADNPSKDFVTPRALGWRTVQIDRPGRMHLKAAPDASARADIVVRSLAMLLPDPPAPPPRSAPVSRLAIVGS